MTIVSITESFENPFVVSLRFGCAWRATKLCINNILLFLSRFRPEIFYKCNLFVLTVNFKN